MQQLDSSYISEDGLQSPPLSIEPARHLPNRVATVNHKFEAFLTSKLSLPHAEAHDQITKYIQVLETNYTEVVQSLKR